MASITMAASFLGGLSPSTQQLSKSTRGGLVMVKASGGGASEKQAVNLNCKTDTKKEDSNGRRDLMFSVAAAAAVVACSSIAGGGAAFAAFPGEPKNGTPEAKKKYAPVCVSMPTSRVCRK